MLILDICVEISKYLSIVDIIHFASVSKSMLTLRNKIWFDFEINLLKVKNLSYVNRFRNLKIKSDIDQLQLYPDVRTLKINFVQGIPNISFDLSEIFPKITSLLLTGYIIKIINVPHQITKLSFKSLFVSSIYVFENLPDTILELTIGSRIGGNVMPKYLPTNLHKLIFENNFNSRLGQIPNTVHQLIFNSKYDQPINFSLIPQSVKYLTIPIRYKYITITDIIITYC